MSERGSSRRAARGESGVPGVVAGRETESLPLRMLDLVPGAWLLLVLIAYWMVLTAPLDTPRQLTAPVPGLDSADRAALPLLLLVLLAGIIRRFAGRRSQAGPQA